MTRIFATNDGRFSNLNSPGGLFMVNGELVPSTRNTDFNVLRVMMSFVPK